MNKTISIQEFKSNLILNCFKIVIIVIFSIVIFSNVVPYFEATHDSYVYALKAISLTKGYWSVSNEFLSETGDWEFVPSTWKKTVFDSAIPKYPPGIPIIGSIAYLVSGTFGLVLLGPFFASILLVVSERVATNLFGKYVGLLTLLFLASNGIISSGGIYLLSDNIFSALTVLGFFCLIKFLYNKNFTYLIFASSLLSFSSFVRVSGIINLPIEIIILIIFFSYTKWKSERKSITNRTNYYKITIS
jgi:4-amino-4-deoxy-L-arabinose transferase-like glycosyltransferase